MGDTILNERRKYQISWEKAGSSLLESELRIKLKCLKHLQIPWQEGQSFPSAQNGFMRMNFR